MPSVRIQPGFGGMNSEASPDYVPATQAAVLENLLPRPGKVVLRGHISAGIDLGLAATATRIYGATALGSGVLVDLSNGGTLGALAVEVQSGTVSALAGTVYPGRRSTVLGGYAYSAFAPGSSGLTRWDGAGAAVELTNGPGGPVVDVTTHLSRLFTVHGSGTISWSDLGGSPANTAAEWQDDVSGLTNIILLSDTDDDAVGLAHAGRSLVVLKGRSIWLLNGLTPSSFVVTKASSEWGCVDVQSIVDHDDGCYFLSERGFAYFDGSQVTDVSADVKGELLAAMRSAPLPFPNAAGGATSKLGSLAAGTRSFARTARVGRDSIMLVIGRETDAVAPTVYFAGIYNVRQGTWSKFSSDAFTAGAPVYFVSTSPADYYSGATLGFDGAGNLLYLDDLVVPESATATLAGKDTVDGTTAQIPAVSYSRIVALSSPGRASQIKRLLFDYSFVVVSDADATVNAWSLSLVDGLGNILLAPTPVPASVLQSGYTDDQRRAALVRKRFQVEFFGEATEVQLRITLPALDAAITEVVAAEIHDATIEFAAGRDRPSA